VRLDVERPLHGLRVDGGNRRFEFRRHLARPDDAVRPRLGGGRGGAAHQADDGHALEVLADRPA
jgi:hypothetical protein